MTAGPDYEHEARFSQSGAVIGVDEAGRGPWAGPVTASAFWINPAQIANVPALLTDSKKLSKAKHQTIR
ncbi:MAG: ribonuclease HII, partial [Candidatus Puniceispirillaceae bacterium]